MSRLLSETLPGPIGVHQWFAHRRGNDEKSIEYRDVIEESIRSRFEEVPVIERIRVLQRIRKSPSMETMVVEGILQMRCINDRELESHHDVNKCTVNRSAYLLVVLIQLHVVGSDTGITDGDRQCFDLLTRTGFRRLVGHPRCLFVDVLLESIFQGIKHRLNLNERDSERRTFRSVHLLFEWPRAASCCSWCVADG